jgi:hypothetical protein
MTTFSLAMWRIAGRRTIGVHGLRTGAMFPAVTKVTAAESRA